MEYNGKTYELIHDKTGNLDCGDCVFDANCDSSEATNECNRYQVWKECALAKNTPTSSEQFATPAVVGQSEQFICRDCGKNTVEWLDQVCEDCTLKRFS